eukprot:COSAG04_NODE_752_length_10578_cov_3.031778_2_plen_171_part_00
MPADTPAAKHTAVHAPTALQTPSAGRRPQPRPRPTKANRPTTAVGPTRTSLLTRRQSCRQQTAAAVGRGLRSRRRHVVRKEHRRGRQRQKGKGRPPNRFVRLRCGCPWVWAGDGHLRTLEENQVKKMRGVESSATFWGGVIGFMCTIVPCFTENVSPGRFLLVQPINWAC